MKLEGTNVYLIGMMGSGKSTVGKLLAQSLGYHFFDTDEVIVQLTKQSVNEIFATSGEGEFRQLETQVLTELSTYKNLVVATGGGIILQQVNWSYLHYGVVVWLDVPIELIYTRLQGDQSRPLLKTADPLAKLQAIFSQRKELYAEADLRISITENDAPEQIVARIKEARFD